MLYNSKSKRWQENTDFFPGPLRNHTTQVFVGSNHALILRANGDLYAIGNNRNGCCGEEQRMELMQFTRIARGVSHAAAGKNHTLYVDEAGKVTILGKSEYTDRFRCEFPVRRVYADPRYDAFLLEDREGKLHFFGERNTVLSITARTIPVQQRILRTLPRICVRERNYNTWGYYPVEYHSCCSQYKEERTIVSGSETCDRNPEIQEVLASDWYRALIMEYGESNVGIRMGDSVQTSQVSYKTFPNGTDHSDYEIVYDHFYEPEVIYINNHIYQPVPCPGTVWNHFIGCWPNYTSTPVLADRTLVKCFQFYRPHESARTFVNLNEKGTACFSSDEYAYDPKCCLQGIADLAVSSFSSDASCKELILVVTKAGDVYCGQRDQLEKAARVRVGLERFQRRTDLWTLMKKVTF